MDIEDVGGFGRPQIPIIQTHEGQSGGPQLDQAPFMSSPPFQNTQLPLRGFMRPLPPAAENAHSNGALDAFIHARRIVRWAQCPQCSKPLHEPVTLPCGNSLCKTCIPDSRNPSVLSFNRTRGFTCPFSSCRQEHAEVVCMVDVVLKKILDSVRIEISRYGQSEDVLLRLEEKTGWSASGISSLQDGGVRSDVLPGGRLAATYAMAEMGHLAYDSEVTYTELPSSSSTTNQDLDTGLMEVLQGVTRPELDCHVCFQILLDPITTLCGHTYCRQCVRRILDYSNYCPMCRRALGLPRDHNFTLAPSNATLNNIINGLCTESLNARTSEKVAAGLGELDTPLFICTISLPTMPTFLYIFEPRYKLMIRRAIESGDRTFGMLLAKPNREPEGDLGPVNFYQYGTLLYIRDYKPLADGSGQSLIETVGLSRFRVVKHGNLDGYTVGKIERFDDISLAAEEALEARETASPLAQNFSAEEHFGPPPILRRPSLPSVPRSGAPTQQSPEAAIKALDKMSTEELMNLCVKFITRMSDISAAWLHRNMIEAYGHCPADPALLPWWFASIVPVTDFKKQKLLQTDSVRERLKMCAGWIVEIEAQTNTYVLSNLVNEEFAHLSLWGTPSIELCRGKC